MNTGEALPQRVQPTFAAAGSVDHQRITITASERAANFSGIEIWQR